MVKPLSDFLPPERVGELLAALSDRGTAVTSVPIIHEDGTTKTGATGMYESTLRLLPDGWPTFLREARVLGNDHLIVPLLAFEVVSWRTTEEGQHAPYARLVGSASKERAAGARRLTSNIADCLDDSFRGMFKRADSEHRQHYGIVVASRELPMEPVDDLIEGAADAISRWNRPVTTFLHEEGHRLEPSVRVVRHDP